MTEQRYAVIVHNRSMRDFVTSNMAVVLFTTQEEAAQYVENLENFHPGRFLCDIKEQPQQAELWKG